ncbi:molybdate ABC transporter permease subunit [Nodosilinea sp. P-1105]|uniref:molybdate ABC transporter permease subunit n=1 Tax=Nodosilinea sp. P-1105 TaxID=2546229 RepID=UPI00146E6C39|nr:molybdate ABC transporter permease subunit [Nodosilinea sp. P-1105]NMF85600.1 molybdate ABC transporter permease subunit [Nodosilinea sp. P-1105]
MPSDLTPLWISLKVAGLATIFAFFVGIAAAYWMLGYRGPGKSVLEGVFVAPLVLPPTVVGFLLLMLFGRSGPLAPLLQALGVRVIFTWYGAVISATVVAFPLMYRTALGAFEQVDITLLQVARTLGAREGRIFWRILLPLSVPGLVAGMTLSFARALGEFGATLMVAGNIPGRTQTMPMAIYFAVQAGAMGQAWTWVLIIMVVSLAGILAANAWQARRRDLGKTENRKPKTEESSAVGQWAEEHGLPNAPYGSLQNPKSPIQNSPRPTHPLPTPPLPTPPPSLSVTLHKSLGAFPLDVQFTAGPEALGILGASGSGKSMTLRCIVGVETPDRGRIVLNGRVLFDRDRGINLPSCQRRVGLLFQTYALFPHLTIAENIGFGLQHLPRLERRQRVSGWLSMMHLQGLGDRYPQQISGGQQQRVALARALAPNPEVLLLDEPLSALDTYLRSQVEQQLIKTLATYPGIALFVTHNLEEVFRVCPQVMVMAAGQAVTHGTRHQVFERPGSAIAAQITGCKNFSRAIPLSAHTLRAEDWGCTLQVAEPIPPNLSQVGFRAHQVQFVDTPHAPNTFPAWVVSTSETPHRVTLFLKLHHPPDADSASARVTPYAPYDLQVEVFKEKWHGLNRHPLPWHIHLAPERILLLSDRPQPPPSTMAPRPTYADALS